MYEKTAFGHWTMSTQIVISERKSPRSTGAAETSWVFTQTYTGGAPRPVISLEKKQKKRGGNWKVVRAKERKKEHWKPAQPCICVERRLYICVQLHMCAESMVKNSRK
jgi:hypothetical protein